MRVTLPLDLSELESRLTGARFVVLLAGLPDRPIELVARIARAETREGETRLEFEPARRSLIQSVNTSLAVLDWRIDSHGRLASPRVLGAVERFEKALDREEAATLGGVLGPAEHLEVMHFMLNLRNLAARRLPLGEVDAEKKIDAVIDRYRLVRGERRLSEILDEHLERGLVVLFLRGANYEDTATLLARMRALVHEHLTPVGIAVHSGGDVALSQAMIRSVVRSQVSSLAISLVLVAACAAILLRSLRTGVICALPAAATLLVLFGVIGWTGMPLGVATSMFAACVLGLGVDGAIHLSSAIRELGVERGLERTLRPVLADALAVGLGFGMLALSQIPPTRRLGLIVALCAGLGFLLTFLIVPEVLGRSRRPLADPGEHSAA